MEESVLLGTKPLVNSIRHFMRDPSDVFWEVGGGGGNRGVNLPSPYVQSQFLPPPYFFEPISPASLNGYVSFSPSFLLFPPISPSSQLCLGHFSLLPILFLPPHFPCVTFVSGRIVQWRHDSRLLLLLNWFLHIIKKKKHYTLARRYEFYVLLARTISQILFLPLEHKIHIFSPACNILYICSELNSSESSGGQRSFSRKPRVTSGSN